MRWRRRFVDLALLLALTACAAQQRRPQIVAAPAPTVKIGKPYAVYGIWYTPADDRNYNENGIASWYGPGFHTLSTANGERYDQDDLTAAHKTLPMPSWVEVENLDNGRKLVVRINDRGPFVAGRIVDLSRRSAQLLGVDGPGTARVRVHRVYPTASLTNVALPKPLPPAAPPPQPATTRGRYIQVAALADPGRIAWLSAYLVSYGPVVTEPAPFGLTRLRLGPYADAMAAEVALAKLHDAGYTQAVLVPLPAQN